jgi:ubiquinone/menaquinone biosynthesis C-methylase UbiE
MAVAGQISDEMNFNRYVAKQFGKPTGFGGDLSTLVMNLLNRRQYRATIENLQVGASDTILDIGFGNGYLINKIAQKDPQKLFGIEISQDMLAKAQRLCCGKAELFLADVRQLPFEDASIDKIYTVNTVYFWENIPEGLAEIRRTLKPGGIFLNTIYDKKWLDKLIYTKYGFSKYTTEQWHEMTKQSGLKIVKTVMIAKDKSACIIAKKL